jgi:site-specific DNA recombinase
LLIRDVLQPFDKALILLDLNADTSTPTGKMVLTVMFGVRRRASITERTQTGCKNKAAKGGCVYGSPAFGLMLNKNNELTLNLDERAVIEIIRKHLKSRKSFDQIAQY